MFDVLIVEHVGLVIVRIVTSDAADWFFYIVLQSMDMGFAFGNTTWTVAPKTEQMDAISSSIWINTPSTSGSLSAIHSIISLEGVIG